MKKTCKNTIKVIIIGIGLLLTIPAFATDYQAYSLDELNAMRGNLATAPTEERDAFRNARQEKMQALTPDERLSYRTNGSQRGGGNGTMTKARDGSGSGSMNRYQGNGSSSGGGMGSGQHRGGRR